MPTRRRDCAQPIDSPRTASLATLRETPCSALTPSSVSTSPGGYSPDTIAVPSALSKLSCRAPNVCFEGHHIHLVIALLTY